MTAACIINMAVAATASETTSPPAPPPPSCGVMGANGILSGCQNKSAILYAEDITYGSGCSGSYTTKITLVTTGASNIEDGTFNSLAIRGAQSACSERNSCCLEVDMPHGSETDYFCEMQYASGDSEFVVGVGFRHADATYWAATCDSNTNYAAIDVAYDYHPGRGASQP